MPGKSWTAEDIALLRELLVAKTKRPQILSEFRKKTPTLNKNAIAGAVWRYARDLTTPLSVKRAPYGSKKKEVRQPGFTNYNIKKAVDRKLPQAEIKDIVDIEIPLTQRKTLLELDYRKHCRWPVNDPKDGNFFYCGGDRKESSVYCACHDRRAYRPSRVRKPRGAGGSQAVIHARKEDAIAFS